RDLLRRTAIPAGVGEAFGDVLVPEPVDDAVGADEEPVALLDRRRGDLGMDELAAAAAGLLQHVLARMGAGLALVEAARPELRPDMGVVEGELLQLAAAVLIETAVADVREGDAGAVEEAADHRRAHAGQFRVVLADAGDVVV